MKSSSALADSNIKFYTRSYRPRKKQIFDFLNVFQNFLSSRKLLCHTWDFGFNSQNGLREVHLLMLPCPNFLTPKVLTRKSTILFLWPFFLKVFDFSRKLPFQIWDFGFSQNCRLRDLLLNNIGYATTTDQFFFSKSFGPRKSKKFWFWDLFFKILTFLENYSPKSNFVASMR